MSAPAQRVVAVTGSARGIGKNIAQAFARDGARVYLCDRDEKMMQATQAQARAAGVEVRALRVDLSERGGPQRMVQEIARLEDRLDVLVNNAQWKTRSSLLEETEESWDAGLGVTLKAAFFASREALPLMGKNGGGSIVNIASIAAFLVTGESPSYHVAKAGLVQLTRYLALNAGSHAVRVNCICPGFIVQDEHRSRFQADDNREYRGMAEHCHPLGVVGRSDDVAQAALFLCSSQAQFVNGHVLVLDGGATAYEQFGLLSSYARK